MRYSLIGRMRSAEALQGLCLNTDQTATKIHLDHLQYGYEVEMGKGLSCEEEEEKKEKKRGNVRIT
jgi:hypothetical protein